MQPVPTHSLIRRCYKPGHPPPGPDDGDPDTQLDDRERTRGDRALVCARCGRAITSESAAVSINDRHEHTCVNMHGYAYRIRCFGGAPGCYPVGGREREWTWFPGYTWQIVHCRGCGLHLGWRFDATDVFFGLIAERITDRDA